MTKKEITKRLLKGYICENCKWSATLNTNGLGCLNKLERVPESKTCDDFEVWEQRAQDFYGPETLEIND